MAAKRKFADVGLEADEPIDPSDELLFTCLGGGNEVGRSCHIIQYKGKTIMVCRHSSVMVSVADYSS
jgi:cleavage and polyadenylation specificity factor subunit 3